MKPEEFDWNNYTPKGNIEYFPKRVIFEIAKRQYEQKSYFKIEDLEANITSVNVFRWSDTKEGHCFWEEVISNKYFGLLGLLTKEGFAEANGKFIANQVRDCYKNCITDIIEDFSCSNKKEIVTRLLVNQVLQGNRCDATIFYKSCSCPDKNGGGMTWSDSIEGFEYWSRLFNRCEDYDKINHYSLNFIPILSRINRNSIEETSKSNNKINNINSGLLIIDNKIKPILKVTNIKVINNLNI